MCGIAGTIDRNADAVRGGDDVYAAMLATMRRRGPDQSGLFVGENAALLHARLAVVDLENGRQPMTLRQGAEKYTIVYNGEIYNTEDLRGYLLALGHRFVGYSDTEVVLHAYAEWKDRCVERLNGIFAFAVWEERRGRLFLARDRIGVKPLFYYRTDGGLLFASELKTLLAHPLVPHEIDREGVAELLLLGPGRTPGCGVFRGIRELLPGSCAAYDLDAGRFETRVYWAIEDQEHRDTFSQTAERVRALVVDAVKRQLVSDVPVCTFLSGGLDSSILSAVADRYFASRGQRLQTVSVDYLYNSQYFHATKFQPDADAAYIERMNRALHAEHHRVLLDTPELVRALYAAVDARDLPGMADVDASLLLFCEQVKEFATVALSGECADEIFGGYPWYRDPEIRDRDGFPWAQSTDYRASFLRPEFADLDAAAFIDERVRATVADAPVLPGTGPLETCMKQMMQLNLRWFMQTLLDRKDRMSMYSGLEVRVPFCDYRIAEYLYAVPWAYKEYGGVEKGLLREAMRGLLPDEVLWRKKSPYPKTHNPAYLAAVTRELRQAIADPDAPVLQLVRRDALDALLDGAARAVPWYGQLMTTPQTIAYFVQLNYWMQKFQVRVV